jgi:hypothetical protein
MGNINKYLTLLSMLQELYMPKRRIYAIYLHYIKETFVLYYNKLPTSIASSRTQHNIDTENSGGHRS